MHLNLQEITESLEKKYYVNVPFPIEKAAIDEAVSAFFKFLEEPDSVKSYIDFTIAPNHRRGDVGFRHREENQHIYSDNKDFFHYHPAIFENHNDFLLAHPAVNEFMLKAKPIWELVYQTISEIFTLFEQKFPGCHHKIFKAQHPHILLRFLRYQWQTSDKYLAKPHFDSGSFTLAIAESEPGLRIGRDPQTLTPVEHKVGNAIFMCSSNFKKVIDSDQFSAGWHDVIQLDETLIGKACARWAVVAFIEAAGVEALPQTETHRWYTNEKAIY